MTFFLIPGQNVALKNKKLTVALNQIPNTSGIVLDSSAYLLSNNGKVPNDSCFLFYGQTSVSNGAARLDPENHRFTLSLDDIPASIDRIALTLTIDQGIKKKQDFTHIKQVSLVIHDEPSEIHFLLETRNSLETALIVGEFYRRNEYWKFRAIGQGFLGGLGPLAKSFGVDIKDDPDQQPAAPTPTPVPVRLEKITLEKKNPVSLEKKGAHFGEILINLNWTRQTSQRSGFLRSKQSENIDLDIGCMFEFHDGRKMLVQALGGNFGSFDCEPWVQLMGDDRTGASKDGENLKINGKYWPKLKRVLVFAFIYEGIPNWASANAISIIKIPDQPDLIVNIDSHSNHHNMCAIALLENECGNLKITKQVNYYSGHEDLDRAYNFGFRWVAASK